MGWVWRLVLLVPLLAVATAALYVLGIAGQRLGWLTAPLVLAGAGGASAWLLFLRHPRRTAVVATVALVGVAGGIALRVVTPMMPSRLAGAVASVELPAGAELVETREFGSATCFDSCPSLLQRHAVPGEAQEVEQRLADAFRADGWSVAAAPYALRTFIAVSPDAAIEARVTVAPESTVEPDEGHEEQFPSVPAGHVLVDVSVQANPCPPGDPGCP